jgi:hypothetical protein
MPAARSFATFAIALTMLGSFATTRADSVVLLNNLDQPVQPTGSSAFVGQSFISGSPEQLYGARMQLDSALPPSSEITLEVEARTADGSVGQTLFSNFSSSYDTKTGLITFLANSPFDLTADTGYWLVLSDPKGNSDPTKGSVTWDFTTSQVYQSDQGYGLPSYNTAYYSNQDHGMGNAIYYQPSDGPQMFQLLAPAAGVPEPSSFLLLCVAMAIAVFGMGIRRARASRFRWPLAAGRTGYRGGAPVSTLSHCFRYLLVNDCFAPSNSFGVPSKII